jgi:lipoprotein-anchoring transpeptidase ErfK/SrfK
VRLKKIVLGLSAVAAVAALAACSSGSGASNHSPALAANTGNNATSSTADRTSQAAPSTPTSTASPTTTTPPVTTPPTTTTKPATTTRPPVITKAPAPATEAAAAGVPCSAAAIACVSLSTHQAWILNNGQIVYGPVHAEGGRQGWTTPVGSFHVYAKAVHYVSHEFHVPMPYAVFFYPGDAFHVGSATTPSHGCIHLSQAAAQTFYHDLSIGDVVQVVH